MHDEHRYDDIICLSHHQSEKHPRMSMEERAAQFSPFAALTGYGAVIAEAGRLTDARIELGDEQKDEIDRCLRDLLADPDAVAEITVFEPDERKDGGRYRTIRGALRRYDPAEGILLLRDGQKIPLDAILSVTEAEN
ncbi:MAG: hypothetical protein IKZ41_11910 [Clostridia bacterium]|nr:hypothetical protein [Clostridia bacterium]MBR5364836.1 hypothetical protein [Clostridia bacterium]